MIKTAIHWNEAIQIVKQEKIEEEQRKIDYEQQLTDARSDVWNALESDMFCSQDVFDIASMHGVDEDDLIFSLI